MNNIRVKNNYPNIFLDKIKLQAKLNDLNSYDFDDLISILTEYSSTDPKISYKGSTLTNIKFLIDYKKTLDLLIKKNILKKGLNPNYYDRFFDNNLMNEFEQNYKNISQSLRVQIKLMNQKYPLKNYYMVFIEFNPNRFVQDPITQSYEPFYRFIHDVIKPYTTNMNINSIDVNVDLNVDFNSLKISSENKNHIINKHQSTYYINDLYKEGSKLRIYDKMRHINETNKKTYYTKDQMNKLKKNKINVTRFELSIKKKDLTKRIFDGKDKI